MPALVRAAQLLFKHEPLPRLKRAESAKIPEALVFIEQTVQASRAVKGRTLLLVTGVPGSGKTLLGLQVAHSERLGARAIFLSGNGPLVQVLKYALGRGAHTFVEEMRKFLRAHGGVAARVPDERVVVFDEAQRAWDRDRILEHHQGQLAGSEPELLVRIGSRTEDGFSIVALIGEGQEIHRGEEAGIGQWVDAVGSSPGWTVIGPPHLAGTFRGSAVVYEEQPLLSLTAGLRSHRASDVALWTESLLNGRLDEAGRLAGGLRQAGFVLRLSRNLDALRRYVRARYEREPAKRFGLIASSKFRRLTEWGVPTARHPYWYYGQWFEAPPTDARSGCQMDLALSEFGCQGLELDLPVICWGPDCVWSGSTWVTTTGRRTRGLRDPHRLRINAYRVLLTRGRDGVAVFVPPSSDMNTTVDALLAAGFERLAE